MKEKAEQGRQMERGTGKKEPGKQEVAE